MSANDPNRSETVLPSTRPQAPDAPRISGDAPGNDGPPLSPLVPDSMHRAEADAQARATSPDFSERRDGATNEPPLAPDDGGSGA